MPLDAICLEALVKELEPCMVGARIDKVQQPAKDLLLLSLYTKDGNRRLLLSAGVGSARLHFTNEKLENPDTPPMFCMQMDYLARLRVMTAQSIARCHLARPKALPR